MEPNVAKYYRNRGLCHQRLNNAELALENFERALVLEPTCVRGLAHMSRQLLIIERLDEAFQYAEKGEHFFNITILKFSDRSCHLFIFHMFAFCLALDYGENHNVPRMTKDEKYQVITLQETIHARKKEKEKARLKVVYVSIRDLTFSFKILYLISAHVLIKTKFY